MLAAISMLLFASFAIADSADAQTLLEGKIEHSESLPPVDSQWQVGAKFDAARLPVTGSGTVIWWRVPDWLAGTWHNIGKVKRLSLKDIEHEEKSQGFDAVDVKYPDAEIIGYQKDRENAVWTCVPAPYVGRTVQGDNTNVSIIYSATPVDINENQVVIRFLATTLTVEKSKGKIVSVSQRESLQTYKPIEKNHILVQASMKFFDENGAARFESKVLSQCARIEGFRETPYLPTPANVPTLIDMRKSFDNFLRRQKLDRLVPERYPLAPVQGYQMISI